MRDHAEAPAAQRNAGCTSGATASTMCVHLLKREAPEGQRASLIGLSESAFGLAGVYAPLLSSALYSEVGPTAPVHVSGGVMLAMCALTCAQWGGLAGDGLGGAEPRKSTKQA